MNSLSFDDSSDCILRIFIAQGVHTDVLLEVSVNKSKVSSVFHFEALLGKKRKERIEVVGLLLQCFINRDSQKFSV